MQTALLAANTHRHDVEVRAIEMENRNNDLKQQLQRLTDLGRDLSGELHQTKQKYSANQETLKKMFAERDADKQMVNEKMNEILRLREHLNPHLLAMDSFKAREAELGGCVYVHTHTHTHTHAHHICVYIRMYVFARIHIFVFLYSLPRSTSLLFLYTCVSMRACARVAENDQYAIQRSLPVSLLHASTHTTCI
jgi:hypothetical protein